MKKMPWGIFAGIFAMGFFFATVAVIALFIILNSIAGQTHTSATLFDEWYQILLFVLDIVFLVGLLASATLYFVNRRKSATIPEEATV